MSAGVTLVFKLVTLRLKKKQFFALLLQTTTLQEATYQIADTLAPCAYCYHAYRRNKMQVQATQIDTTRAKCNLH